MGRRRGFRYNARQVGADLRRAEREREQRIQYWSGRASSLQAQAEAEAVEQRYSEKFEVSFRQQWDSIYKARYEREWHELSARQQKWGEYERLRYTPVPSLVTYLEEKYKNDRNHDRDVFRNTILQPVQEAVSKRADKEFMREFAFSSDFIFPALVFMFFLSFVIMVVF